MLSNIPEEIRKLKPTNTRIKPYKDHYLVIARTCKSIGNRNVPVELGTIGHIKLINGVWSYIEKKTSFKDLKLKPISTFEYGFLTLADNICSSLLLELKEVYSEGDAILIYVICLLRIAYSNVSRDMAVNYENDYISIRYPNLNLNDSNLSNFYKLLGSRYALFIDFMNNRINNSSGKYIIDGMLKTNDSTTNTLSEYSRKGNKKGREDISLIYTYDTITKEPIASRVYPGNMLDQRTLIDYLSSLNVKSGLIVMDKGFYNKINIEFLNSQKDLHYLIPIKRNHHSIEEFLLDQKYDGLLKIKENQILYKKVYDNKNNCFYYAFSDIKISKNEAFNYLKKNRSKSNVLSQYEEKQSKFGLIVFESNVDLEPIEIYQSYEDRWNIELVFKYYQSLLDFDTLRVQSDNRAYAIEFLNFICSIMTMKIKKHYSYCNLSEKHSYDEIKNYLFKLKKVRIGSNGDFINNKQVKWIEEFYRILGVV